MHSDSLALTEWLVGEQALLHDPPIRPIQKRLFWLTIII